MPFKNKIVVGCKVCGENVPVGTGWTEGPPWVTKCQKCSGVAPSTSSKPRITITPKGDRAVSFKAVDYLGGDLFSAFRAAIEGSKFDPITKSNEASFEKALRCIERLTLSGKFIVDIDPSLVASLQAKTSTIKTSVADASVRALKADELLKQRGLFLFGFQKAGVEFMAARDGALLADEMGLGKTIQALIALPDNAPVLVVAPAVAKGVWKREVARWRPEYQVEVLSGRGSFRWPAPGEFLIINYDILPPEAVMTAQFQPNPALPLPAPGTVVIADEAHGLKNSKAARTQRFRGLSAAARDNGGRAWALTATPLLNRPPELWNVLTAFGLAQEAFGSYKQFVTLFDGTPDNWGGMIWGTPSAEVPDRLRRVSLRRMRHEVLPDLPVKTWRTVDVDIKCDAKTKKLLDKAAELFATYTRFSRINEEPKPSDIIANDPVQAEIEEARKLISSISGTDFEQLSRSRALLAKAKIPALFEMVEEFEQQDEPVVVFSAHRAPIDMFEGREGWAVITGDTKPEDRTRIEDAFQAGKLKGVAATIKAGGVAITLTRAHQAIFVDLDWTPALNAQAEDRVCRIGQTRGVVITYLVASHPLDERVFALLSVKKDMIGASVDASTVVTSSVKIPDVDMDALVAAATVERERDEQAQKEAQAEAAARRQEFAGREEEVAKKERDGRKERYRQANLDRWTREATTDGEPRHAPKTAREQWAAQAITTLADLDPDRAFAKNEVGFSAADGAIGHKLAFLVSRHGLTAQQWGLTQALCAKYWRQIGKMPEKE